MKSIKALELVDDFEIMLREHWRYEWSGCSRGVVSCSGAFTWAYKQHGLEIYQGSNRIARRHVVQLLPYAQAKAEGLIVPGMAAFKVRKPGAKSYALPEAYKPGGKYYNRDLNDYYHIGLVDRDVGFVLNAQSAATGFVRSKITENWSHVALLSAVDYGREEETDMRGIVYAKNGGYVNIRDKPGGTATAQVKPGSVCEAGEPVDGWIPVRIEGYIKADFIKQEGHK